MTTPKSIDFQPIYNTVIVTVEKEFIDELQYGSLKLQISGQDYNEDLSLRAQRFAKVVSVPRAMAKPLHKINPIVKVGDTIMVHYGCISDDYAFDIGDEKYFIIQYDDIYAIIHDDGNITMVGNRILCEPVYDGDDDVVMDDGVLVRRTKSGIIYEMNVGHSAKVAKLSFIGDVPKSSSLNVSPGDFVVYDRDADFEHTINGKKYFCMTQEDILLVL